MKDDDNDKGTFTEEEYLNMKTKERILLLTVMEDELMTSQEKIQELREKLEAVQNERDENEINLKKVLHSN